MKKGQAAMEYLMTYGWAILIIIVVVAALYAMGVFKLPGGGMAPCSPCFPPASDVVYVDHTADSLVIRVGPRKIQDVKVYVDGNVISGGAGPFDTGDTITFTSTGAFSGDKSIVVEYVVNATGLTHNVTATLHGA